MDKIRFQWFVCVAVTLAIVQASTAPVAACCSFYVTKGDSKPSSNSSKVVVSRKGNETTITMASDYAGDTNQFALIVPVPNLIERRQISVVDWDGIDHLDAYSASMLVENTDMDPCPPPADLPALLRASPGWRFAEVDGLIVPHDGVAVEARYNIADYDISILSTAQSHDLMNWLADNGYKVPDNAAPGLESYIKQNMHFFLAKVNLDRMKFTGKGYLRPLQVRYETPEFTLPLRIGALNSNGPQDLIVYALTEKGPVESANYPNVKIPTHVEAPLYVKDDFGRFYEALFDRAVARENTAAVFIEYAGFIAAHARKFAELGAGWVDDSGNREAAGDGSVFLTCLHIRYDAQSFPEDIAFLEPQTTEAFGRRYFIRHPWTGDGTCAAAQAYRDQLPATFLHQATDLANLTGWPRREIEERMAATGQAMKGR